MDFNIFSKIFRREGGIEPENHPPKYSYTIADVENHISTHTTVLIICCDIYHLKI